MKRKDHLALTGYLIGLCPGKWQKSTLRGAFYAGSTLPDCNPATYLRGITGSGRLAGHNTEYSYPQILRLLSGLRYSGVKDPLHAYRLGALIHYLADAFTYPHTPSFTGNIPAHNAYERDLHRVFSDALCEKNTLLRAPEDPVLFLWEALCRSREEIHTPRGDAARIVRVCTGIYWSVFQENRLKSPNSNKNS